jgi:hypothetical protein
VEGELTWERYVDRIEGLLLDAVSAAQPLASAST